MLEFITLDEASNNVRRDTVDDNADLQEKIRSASSIIKNYLKSASPWEFEIDTFGDPVLDSAGDKIIVLDSGGRPIARPEVKQATRYLVGMMYDDRDGQKMKEWQHGYLPFPVTSVLYPLRTPAMA